MLAEEGFTDIIVRFVRFLTFINRNLIIIVYAITMLKDSIDFIKNDLVMTIFSMNNNERLNSFN